MTKFIGWTVSCGAVVTVCEPGPSRGTMSIEFDRPTRLKSLCRRFVFNNDGTHHYDTMGSLIEPGIPLDVTKPCTYRRKPVTMLTTGALGEYPIIFTVAGEGTLRWATLHGRTNTGGKLSQ